MEYQSSSNYLITVLEFPGIFWTEFSGGEASNDTTLQHVGGFGPPQVISGPASTGQITLTKPRDHVEDIPIQIWDKAYDRGIQQPLTVTVIPTTPAGVPIGPSMTWRGSKRVSCTFENPSKGSADAATVQLVLQPRERI